MTPLSAFRVFGLGILSWAILGLGVYLAYSVYDQLNQRVVAVDTARIDQPLDEDLPVRTRPINTTARSWDFWAALAGAVACLLVSVGGMWPAKWISSQARGPYRSTVAPSQASTISRPDGSVLSVEVFGPASGPTLVLTHGWSLDATAWEYTRGELSRRYRVVTWDLAGLGRSRGPRTGDYSLEKLAGDLEAVVQFASASGPVMLVGHSIGGMMLQTFCRLYKPHLGRTVKSLALVHTTYTNPLRTNIASGVTTALEPLCVGLNYLIIATAPLFWLSNWQSYLNGSLHLTTRWTSFAGRQTAEQLDHAALLAAQAWPAVVARGNLAMLKFDEQPELPEVSIPVLVVAGSQDRLTVPAASRHLASLFKKSEQRSVEGGHLGYWERAEETTDLLIQFAERTLASQPHVATEPIQAG